MDEFTSPVALLFSAARTDRKVQDCSQGRAAVAGPGAVNLDAVATLIVLLCELAK